MNDKRRWLLGRQVCLKHPVEILLLVLWKQGVRIIKPHMGDENVFVANSLIFQSIFLLDWKATPVWTFFRWISHVQLH